jgi:hypothetical protein
MNELFPRQKSTKSAGTGTKKSAKPRPKPKGKVYTEIIFGYANSKVKRNEMRKANKGKAWV